MNLLPTRSIARAGAQQASDVARKGVFVITLADRGEIQDVWRVFSTHTDEAAARLAYEATVADTTPGRTWRLHQEDGCMIAVVLAAQGPRAAKEMRT